MFSFQNLVPEWIFSSYTFLSHPHVWGDDEETLLNPQQPLQSVLSMNRKLSTFFSPIFQQLQSRQNSDKQWRHYCDGRTCEVPCHSWCPGVVGRVGGCCHGDGKSTAASHNTESWPHPLTQNTKHFYWAEWLLMEKRPPLINSLITPTALITGHHCTLFEVFRWRFAQLLNIFTRCWILFTGNFSSGWYPWERKFYNFNYYFNTLNKFVV